MTTVAPAGRTVARRAVTTRSRRRQVWASSWRAALRLARRDARRHRGSSALIVVMVGLPVLLIAAASSLLATSDVSVRESLPVVLGHAQAQLSDQGQPLSQDVDGQSTTSGDPQEAVTFPGHRTGQPWTRAQLQRLTGAAVAQVGHPDLFAEVDGALLRSRTLALDPDAIPESGLATLVSGRWPSSADEVAVTTTGMRAGLPAPGGTVPLRGDTDQLRPVTVTGVVEASDAGYHPVDLLVSSSWIPADDPGQFLVSRPRPVTWDDVKAWNAYGFVVLSRAVLADPPAEATAEQSSGDAESGALVVLVCLGLVLETTLLAGPAFAVSAARRRRALAVIAGNGADERQLTRYVVSQAVVLGGGAVVVGGLLGTGAGWAAARVTGRVSRLVGDPPLDVYLPLTVMVCVAALVASLVSAALPARGAARLALAGALGGEGRPRPPSARWTRVGAVLVGAGVALAAWSLWGLTSNGQLYGAGASAALMALGSLCGISALLRVLGVALRRGPVALRMAARDASRAGSRSVPAIAAVTVAVAVVTVAGIGATSDDHQSRRDYTAQAQPGQGSVYPQRSASTGTPAIISDLRRQHPDWRTQPTGTVGSAYGFGSATGSTPLVAVVPPGCPAVRSLGNGDDGGPPDRCQLVGGMAGVSVYAYPPDGLDPRVRLSGTQRAVLSRGGILVGDPGLLRDGTVRLAVGTLPTTAAGGVRITRQLDLAAAVLAPAQLRAATWNANGSDVGALLLTGTVDRLGLPFSPGRWLVSDPHGAISRADEDAVNRHSVDQLSVERGFESPVQLIVRILLGVAALLVVVAALISTALGQVEARDDLATLAAVGATGGFRRRMAAAQGLLVALVGTVLGVAVGVLPGVVMAVSLTNDSYSPDGSQVPAPVVAVPWLGLLALVVAVPALCALVAAVIVPRRPVLTRRLT